MDNKANFLIYGSYGYTGKLIAELCVKEGLKPILGGRNKEQLMQQAKILNLDYRVFDLDNEEKIKNNLQDFLAVINCAGPFLHTYKQMVKACLVAKTHYLDITGEVRVIEELMGMDEQAKAVNIMLLPGTGFDVVPSDCLAQHLKSLLPDASELTLAIAALEDTTKQGVSVSRGTARSMLEGLSAGSLIRDQGILKSVPLNWKTRTFNFGNDNKILCTTVAWGDLASAWWSTGIPHIETYMALPKKMIQLSKWLNPIKSILRWPPLKRYLNNKINQLPEGPTSEARRNSTSIIYGEVKNKLGVKKAALITTPNGYSLTALTTLAIIHKVLSGEAPGGFQTPSLAYTKDLIMQIPGVVQYDMDS